MRKQHKKLILTSIISACAFASPQILAHSSFQFATGEEGVKVYNNIVVGHGCDNKDSAKASVPVIANSMVLANGQDSTILIDGTINNLAKASDYLTNWPSSLVKNIPSTDTFKKQDAILYSADGYKFTSYGKEVYFSVIGKTSLDGSIPGSFNTGLIPFFMTAPGIVTGSGNCAKTVIIEGAIADICKFTNTKGLAPHTANIWMPKGTGSKFDIFELHGLDSPAKFTVTRKSTNPLDASCGAGQVITIRPSAAQLNKDLPIKGRWAN
jgi:hypothetical protein